jgi:biotin carboxyl carrier protein
MTDGVGGPDPKPPGRRSGGARRDAPAPAVEYTVELAGRSVVVTLSADRVLLDGIETPATLVPVPNSPIQMLRIGDTVRELVSHRADTRGSYVISVAGERIAVEALDERARAVRSLRAASGAPAGPEPLRAPMPGMVSRVLVAPGDVVKAGASLIVMEAMKMENELRAKSDARVRSVAVQPGTAVEKGTLLVELE